MSHATSALERNPFAGPRGAPVKPPADAGVRLVLPTGPMGTQKDLIIIGGGLAGLSAGCYARASGLRTTIIEHNLALGGVCTAWPRGGYMVDGCIHWLTCGPFLRLYAELGIIPALPLRTIEDWLTWRDVKEGIEVHVTRDLDALARELRALAPEDGAEIARILEGAERVADMAFPGISRPPELTTMREQLHGLWHMKESLGTFVHFRKPIGDWARDHLKSPALRALFTHLAPPEAPALFLLMILGYLRRGYLSRPVGGTAAFRDALVRTYERLGGEAKLNATADEILVEGGRARGVRLDDGTMMAADAVLSTSSAPETVLRLLGGRFGAAETRERMERWKMFQPIVIASFGVAAPLPSVPATLLVYGLPPFEIGGQMDDFIYLRTYNNDPSLAPPGHSVVQAFLATDYTWWATRGTSYGASKDEIAAIALSQIERAIPGVADHVRMTDVATPLTFWHMARSWRGAYEGWIPNADSLFGHVRKTLPGLEGFYMAGQWVEPGGGVPTAVMSGRQAVQLLCAAERVPFVADPAHAPSFVLRGPPTPLELHPFAH